MKKSEKMMYSMRLPHQVVDAETIYQLAREAGFCVRVRKIQPDASSFKIAP